MGDAPVSTSPSQVMDDINLNGIENGGNSSNDDELVVGEDEEMVESKDAANGMPYPTTNITSVVGENNSMSDADLSPQNEKTSVSGDIRFSRFETPNNEELFENRPTPEWVGCVKPSDFPVSGPGVNPFEDYGNDTSVDIAKPVELAFPPISSPSSGESLPNGTPTFSGSSVGSGGSDSSQRANAVPSLFEEDVEFVGVELEGTEKAMERALQEGIVGEAGPLKRNMVLKEEKLDDGGAGMKEFNDANYWRVEQEVTVLE